MQLCFLGLPWQRYLDRLLLGNDLHDSHLRCVVEVLPRFDNDVQVGVTTSVNNCRRLVGQMVNTGRK